MRPDMKDSPTSWQGMSDDSALIPRNPEAPVALVQCVVRRPWESDGPRLLWGRWQGLEGDSVLVGKPV